eukprot:scaffold19192_cov67-Phaeocystis_antarctica.AAC.9
MPQPADRRLLTHAPEVSPRQIERVVELEKRIALLSQDLQVSDRLHPHSGGSSGRPGRRNGCRKAHGRARNAQHAVDDKATMEIV